MTRDDISEFWHKLQSRQFTWAFRAYNRLVSTLSAEVQERLTLGEEAAEPYVVVFGKTQVGKTTLLLDLMGIAPQHMPTISRLLRGGRPAGKSATATAMEYCRSVNDRWGLTLQSETHWFDSDDHFAEQLGALRERMESGMLIIDAPCVAHIPIRFFAHKNSAMPEIRILDLPGDNPSHEGEQKYVNQMAKTYLPFADLILLVGRGDDLSFLRPDAITLPGIEDWQAMPHRFRIVTTYSYSAQSVKDLMRNDAHYDIGKIRQRLREQIALFGSLSKAASDDNLYFPLEFGTSWMSMKHNEPELYTRISPLVGLLREELLAQIASSTSQMGRLRGTLNTHLSIKYIQTKKAKSICEIIDRLKKEVALLSQDIDNCDSNIKLECKKSKGISSMLALNMRESGTVLVEEAAKCPQIYSAGCYPPQESQRKNDRETLKAMVSDYYRLLRSMSVEVPTEKTSQKIKYWGEVRNQLKELKPQQQDIEAALDDAFESIRYKLNNYTFDTYLFPSRYRADSVLVHNAGEQARENLIQLWISAWRKAINQVDNAYKEKLFRQQTKLAQLDNDRQNKYEEKIFLSGEITRHETELTLVNETMHDDLNRCEQLVHMLDEEYLIELSKQLDGVFQEKDDCDALLQLLACSELENQRKDLLNLTQKHPR